MAKRESRHGGTSKRNQSKANEKRTERYMDMPLDMIAEEEARIQKEREKQVQKSSELVRNFRANMNTPQFKMTLYIISKAYTAENSSLEFTFDIQDFCRCCGLDYESGGNYARFKRDLKNLANNSQWVEVYGNPDIQVLVRLISKAWVSAKSGQVKIRLDEDIKPYICDLYKKWEDDGEPFTSFALLYTLPMRSLYSIRLYELVRSWCDPKKKFAQEHYWRISDLQELLGSEYERYTDFRRFVIEPAITEINRYSDLVVSAAPIKEGRSYKYINFIIEPKPASALLKIESANHKILDGQMSFEDYDNFGNIK